MTISLQEPRPSAEPAAVLSIATSRRRYDRGARRALTAHGQLLRLAPAVCAQHQHEQQLVRLQPGRRSSRAASCLTRSRGTWTVPTATQHTAGQAEASSDWIGIGGGCIDAGCTASDSTLIQTGTEQDVERHRARRRTRLGGSSFPHRRSRSEHDGHAGRPHDRLDRRGRARHERVDDHDQGHSAAASRSARRCRTPPPTAPPSGSRRPRSRSARAPASPRCRT